MAVPPPPPPPAAVRAKIIAAATMPPPSVPLQGHARFSPEAFQQGLQELFGLHLAPRWRDTHVDPAVVVDMVHARNAVTSMALSHVGPVKHVEADSRFGGFPLLRAPGEEGFSLLPKMTRATRIQLFSFPAGLCVVHAIPAKGYLPPHHFLCADTPRVAAAASPTVGGEEMLIRHAGIDRTAIAFQRVPTPPVARPPLVLTKVLRGTVAATVMDWIEAPVGLAEVIKADERWTPETGLVEGRPTARYLVNPSSSPSVLVDLVIPDTRWPNNRPGMLPPGPAVEHLSAKECTPRFRVRTQDMNYRELMEGDSVTAGMRVTLRPVVATEYVDVGWNTLYAPPPACLKPPLVRYIPPRRR